MTVTKELKLKARLFNAAEISKKLKKIAKYVGKEESTDYFFSSKNVLPIKEFRLRKSKDDKIVTLKVSISNQIMQENEEYKFKVDNGDDFVYFIEMLGFKPTSTIRKKSEVYKYGESIISLSEIENIGTYLEIVTHSKDNYSEEDKENLLNILKTLNLSELDIDNRYYSDIKQERDEVMESGSTS